MKDLENQRLTQSMLSASTMRSVASRQDDMKMDNKSQRTRSVGRFHDSNDETHSQIENKPGYYGPVKSDKSLNANDVAMDEAINASPCNMNKPHRVDKYDSRKSYGDDGCEFDRRINRRKHRSDSNDAYSNANYDNCPVSSSDDTSKKEK